MSKLIRFFLVGTLLLIAGCAQYALQKPGKVTVGGNLTVNAGEEWSRLATGRKETWTVDGQALQELLFVTETDDGDSLFEGVGEQKMPKFKAGMTPIEIAETIQASVAIKEIRDFKVIRLRPFKLGGESGFRFEFSYTSKDGLDKLGFVAGIERKKKLTLIIYSGARLHYHDKLKSEAEHIVSSVKFL